MADGEAAALFQESRLKLYHWARRHPAGPQRRCQCVRSSALPRRGYICQPRVAPRDEALPWVPTNGFIPQRGFIPLGLPERPEVCDVPRLERGSPRSDCGRHVRRQGARANISFISPVEGGGFLPAFISFARIAPEIQAAVASRTAALHLVELTQLCPDCVPTVSQSYPCQMYFRIDMSLLLETICIEAWKEVCSCDSSMIALLMSTSFSRLICCWLVSCTEIRVLFCCSNHC